jgi:hypothetical protein
MPLINLTPDIQQGRDPAALRPMPKRTGTDNEWKTPSDLIIALLNLLPPPGKFCVWEPAAGDGRIFDALRAVGHNVVASDIVPQRADIARLDFLNDDVPEAAIGGVVATNPPFARSGLGDKFLRRGLELLDRKRVRTVVFLQRHDASTADCRVEIFKRALFEVRCCWRPRWIEGSEGNGRWAFSWWCWCAEKKGPPMVQV